jgi:radical SAM superfamily enzyme YgiQ (UPF0313 family)
MSRIALLRTPKTLGFPFNDFLCFPLGLMYIASSLRKFGNHDVTIIDPKVEHIPYENMLKMIGDFSADFAGISGMTYEADELHKMARIIKQSYPGIITVVGGVHASVAPEELIKDDSIDYVISGDGEEAFCKLIDAVNAGQINPGLPGLAFRVNGRPVINERIISDTPLDSLPFPAWDLVDLEKYFPKVRQSVIHAHERYMSIFTSRGCPYQCVYCHPVFGKKYRTRSAQNVCDEINILYHKYGIRELHVADDTFNLDIPRAEKILDFIIENKLDLRISFPNGVRADRLTDRLLNKMKKAGTFMVSYAIETASPRMQKIIKKNVELDKVFDIVKKTDKLGIIANGFFMIGFPGETREEIEMTIRYALKSKFHTASFFVVTPNPGTELYEMVKDSIGKKPDEGALFHYFHPYGICEVDDAELQQLLKKANYLFYLNPVRMLRFLQLLPQKKDIPNLFLRFAKRTFLKAYKE